MNRIRIIINLLLGKEIIIYNTWTKKVLMIIGSDEEIITKRYNYDFIKNDSQCLYGNEETGELFFKHEDKM